MQTGVHKVDLQNTKMHPSGAIYYTQLLAIAPRAAIDIWFKTSLLQMGSSSLKSSPTTKCDVLPRCSHI